jgi:multisubunit Na+/H+ antiporter MnhG subunit
MLGELIFSLVGIISFVLFVIFYQRIEVVRIVRTTNVEFWAFMHMLFGMVILGTRIRAWIEGSGKDYGLILVIVVIVVTGAIMLRLASAYIKTKLEKELRADIDKHTSD